MSAYCVDIISLSFENEIMYEMREWSWDIYFDRYWIQKLKNYLRWCFDVISKRCGRHSTNARPLINILIKHVPAIWMKIVVDPPLRHFQLAKHLIPAREKLTVCDVTHLPYMDINWQSISIYMVMLWRHWPPGFRARILNLNGYLYVHTMRGWAVRTPNVLYNVEMIMKMGSNDSDHDIACSLR